MKNLISIVLTIILLASCSTTNTFNKGPFQKRKYSKGFYTNKKSNTNVVSNKNEKAPVSFLKEIVVNDIKKQEPFEKSEKTISPKVGGDKVSDSVKVELKNGDTYVGVKINEDKDGFSIRQKNGRVVYLVHKDIKELVPLKNNTSIQREEELEVKKAVEPYSYITNKNEPTWTKNKKTNLKAPAPSISAFIIFGVSLLITFASPSLAAISLILFIVGTILSIIGVKKAKKQPSLFNVKKAKRIMWLYLAPLLLFLTLISVAIAAYSI